MLFQRLGLVTPGHDITELGFTENQLAEPAGLVGKQNDVNKRVLFDDLINFPKTKYFGAKDIILSLSQYLGHWNKPKNYY